MKISKKILAVLIAVITVFGIMSFAAAADDKTVYVISGSVNVTITTPVAGEKPSIDCKTSSDNFTVTAFTWYDKATGEIIDPAGTDFTYVNGGEYIAKITLKPNENYKFADDVTVTVNDSAPTTIRFKDDTITVEANFTCDKGASGNSFFKVIKTVLLQLLKIIRDIIGHIVGM